MSLRDQVTLVMGAARGIGRATAIAFAREGSHVVVAGIRPERLDGTLTEIRSHGVRGLALACDIADEAQVEQTIATTMAEFGRLDIVVNSAVWMDPPGSLLDMTREVWDRTLAVDLTGAFLLSKHSLRAMLPAKRGRLIHIGSEIYRRASTRRGAYAAAKAGMTSLVMSLAATVGHTDIKVNAICPMGIAGEHNQQMRQMISALDGKPGESVADYAKVAATMTQPEEVAGLAVFLASPAAIHINGQAIIIGEASASG